MLFKILLTKTMLTSYSFIIIYSHNFYFFILGYLSTSVAEPNLQRSTWSSSSVTGWSCSNIWKTGVTGTSADETVCSTGTNKPYVLSGCSVTRCTVPTCPSGMALAANGNRCTKSGTPTCAVYDDTTLPRCNLGYYWARKSNDKYTRTGFLLRSLICDAGWKSSNGFGTTTRCSSNGNPWSYSGCSKCVVGQYNALRQQSSCKTCPIGWYQSQQGLKNCKQCPTGQYTNQNARSVCKSCPGGKYTDQNARSVCKTCVLGGYQNENSKISCKSCPGGKYTNENARSGCKSCGKGSYQNSNGQR